MFYFSLFTLFPVIVAVVVVVVACIFRDLPDVRIRYRNKVYRSLANWYPVAIYLNAGARGARLDPVSFP